MKWIIIFLLISTPVYAEWTTQDTMFQAVFIGVTAIDCWQTYTFLYIDKDGSEKNPILRKYPSKKKCFTMWSIGVVSHTAIAYILSTPYRTFWQFIWIGIETDAIYHNYNAGVRLNF